MAKFRHKDTVYKTYKGKTMAITNTGIAYESSNNRRLAPRVFMELYLNRPLNKNEIVHCKDGNKQNVNKSNLVLFSNQSEFSKYLSEKRGLRKYKDYPPKNLLKELYIKKGLSYRQVGRELNIPGASAKWLLHYYDIKMRKQGRQKK